MAKPAVIIIGADKGGVGKTTVARTLLDYFIAHQVPVRAFDTEAPRGTLKRFHPDVTDVVDMTAVPDQMKIFDTLNSSQATVTVMDVRAGLMSPTLKALRDIGFIDAARKGQSLGPKHDRMAAQFTRQRGVPDAVLHTIPQVAAGAAVQAQSRGARDAVAQCASVALQKSASFSPRFRNADF
jgi:hypothetical protein